MLHQSEEYLDDGIQTQLHTGGSNFQKIQHSIENDELLSKNQQSERRDNSLERCRENGDLERREIMTNICLMSFAFLLIFNVGGLSMLQSSLHRVEGMGVITSSVSYAALLLSCMFLPTITIDFLGHKWTMALCFWGYILYTAANGYAVWGTMVPASILMGLCAAPLWTAQCSYFTIIGGRYAKLNHEAEDAVVSRFFGIFFMFFRICEFQISCLTS